MAAMHNVGESASVLVPRADEEQLETLPTKQTDRPMLPMVLSCVSLTF
jgi:hypothetical protein